MTVATFSYDALARRIESTGSFGPSSGAELYYYDGQRVLAEYNTLAGSGTGTLARYFVDGPTYIDEHLLVHDEAADEDYYYLLRELYSVIGLSDETGALVESCVYDAYGKAQMYDATQSPIAFSSVGNRYAFTGRRLDAYQSFVANPRLDLYHYRARAYDPFHGRFLQRDPLEYVDGMNLYEYVRSNPAINLDPSGRATGPWIADGKAYDEAKWTAHDRQFFLASMNVSLPTAGWIGVLLEVATAVYPAGIRKQVTNFTDTSQYGPGDLQFVTCYCPWKKKQPCKRCVTTATSTGNNSYTFTEKWQSKEFTSYAVTVGNMLLSHGQFHYTCDCRRPNIQEERCLKKPKAKCGCPK